MVPVFVCSAQDMAVVWSCHEKRTSTILLQKTQQNVIGWPQILLAKWHVSDCVYRFSYKGNTVLLVGSKTEYSRHQPANYNPVHIVDLPKRWSMLCSSVRDERCMSFVAQRRWILERKCEWDTKFEPNNKSVVTVLLGCLKFHDPADVQMSYSVMCSSEETTATIITVQCNTNNINNNNNSLIIIVNIIVVVVY